MIEYDMESYPVIYDYPIWAQIESWIFSARYLVKSPFLYHWVLVNLITATCQPIWLRGTTPIGPVHPSGASMLSTVLPKVSAEHQK